MPDLQHWLAQHRNRDGGWPYRPGKASRIEPTCWALLALAAENGRPAEIDVLQRWPRQDAWLVDVTGVAPNIAFSALAGLVLHTRPEGATRSREIAGALLVVRGLKLGQGSAIRQDNSLQAWPWIDGTFSWVEPTSWALLLVKKHRSQLPAGVTTERVAIAESMLIDRVCAPGGWNYGGSNAFGRDLFPYVPTTAIALMALQDRRGEAVVGRSLGWLTEHATKEPSGLTLALALIAARLHRADAPRLAAALSTLGTGPADRGDVLGVAASLYAQAAGADRSAFAL